MFQTMRTEPTVEQRLCLIDGNWQLSRQEDVLITRVRLLLLLSVRTEDLEYEYARILKQTTQDDLEINLGTITTPLI